MHGRAKAARDDRHLHVLAQFHEPLEKRLPDARIGRPGEPRPITFVGVRRQGELGYEKNASTHLPDVVVHPTFLVRKDTVCQEPLQQPLRLSDPIATLDAYLLYEFHPSQSNMLTV